MIAPGFIAPARFQIVLAWCVFVVSFAQSATAEEDLNRKVGQWIAKPQLEAPEADERNLRYHGKRIRLYELGLLNPSSAQFFFDVFKSNDDEASETARYALSVLGQDSANITRGLLDLLLDEDTNEERSKDICSILWGAGKAEAETAGPAIVIAYKRKKITPWVFARTLLWLNATPEDARAELDRLLMEVSAESAKKASDDSALFSAALWNFDRRQANLLSFLAEPSKAAYPVFGQANIIDLIGDLEPRAIEAIPALIKAAKKRESGVSGHAAVALAKIAPEDPDVVRILNQAAKEVDIFSWMKQFRHSPKFFRQYDKEAIEKLEAMDDLRDEGYAAIARCALWQISAPDTAVEKLSNALLSENDSLRAEAARCLGELGASAATARMELNAMASYDENLRVRGTAIDALRQIRWAMQAAGNEVHGELRPLARSELSAKELRAEKRKKRLEFHYRLIISSDFDDYDRDDEIIVHFGTTNCRLIAHVNGSPVAIISDPVLNTPIEEFLQPGGNAITFEGQIKEPLFAKVFAVLNHDGDERVDEEWEVKELIGKIRLKPDEKMGEIRFDWQGMGGPGFEKLPTDADSKKRLKEELRTMMGELLGHIKRSDGAAYIERLNRDLPPIPRIGLSEERIEVTKRSLTQAVSDRHVEMLTTLDDLKFFFGKRSVLVYSGASDPEIHVYKQLMSRRRPVYFAPLRFVRLNGKWVPW